MHKSTPELEKNLLEKILTLSKRQYQSPKSGEGIVALRKFQIHLFQKLGTSETSMAMILQDQ
jgi:hypothetical protein